LYINSKIKLSYASWTSWDFVKFTLSIRRINGWIPLGLWSLSIRECFSNDSDLYEFEEIYRDLRGRGDGYGTRRGQMGSAAHTKAINQRNKSDLGETSSP